MKKKIVKSLCGTAVLLFAGCFAILPDGKAPEGRITDNSSGAEKLTFAELKNNAATSLSCFFLTCRERCRVDFRDTASQELLNNASSVAAVEVKKNAPLVLELDRTGKNFFFKLTDSKNGKVLWSYPEQN